MEIDIERLKSDLIYLLEGGIFIGGYKGMIYNREEIEDASIDTLIEIANQYHFSIEDYIISKRIR